MNRKFEYVSRIENKDFSLPKRSTKNSAGYDFFNPERVEIPPYKIGTIEAAILKRKNWLFLIVWV